MNNMRTLAIWTVPFAQVTLKDGAITSTGVTNKDGYYAAQLNNVPYVEVIINAQGYKLYHETITVPLGNYDLHLEGKLIPISIEIIINGRFFYSNGTIWRYTCCSDFNLFPLFVRGQMIEMSSVIMQRVDLGFNAARTFVYAGNGNPFALDPHSYSANQLQDFIGICNQQGLKVELTKGDAQFVLPNQADQIAHQQLVDSVIGNNFNETCNEPFKNGIDVSVVIPRNGIRSSGDYDDNTSHTNALDYITYHGRRDGSGLAPKWLIDNVESVLDGWPGFPAWTIPFVHDEPMGFAENAIDGKRSNDQRLAFLLGDKIGRWLSGGTFHSDQGINSELFTGITLECAKQFVRGMNLAPLI